MPRILLVTNDYPPTIGGIQSYLRDFLATLPPEEVMVFASTQDREAARMYDAEVPHRVIRWPRRVMLPTPATAREMQRIIRDNGIEVVWFGAAAPLALMGAKAREAGARTVIATTHGHEVGWSMLPGARQALRVIGNNADIVTYISDYTLRRFRRAFGSHPQFVHLPSGVDVDTFRPLDASGRAAVREQWGLGERPVIVCISRLVPRKGQDSLLRALPSVHERFPDAQLIIVGKGSYAKRLKEMARGLKHVTLTGPLEFGAMVRLLGAADIFAMPARTRGKGLDVEGLGIVYLEAQACAVPVVAGQSGGAPETVTADSGIVVDGRDEAALTDALVRLLGDDALRRQMGAAGRRHVEESWTWEVMGQRLREITS
ncbi:glycosyltransferase family 4 protein [Corynebacterium incognita]|uniref:phosphatidyl-myo-inositol dimannoside synthase n=1 Tax=Corynebacterium incognita TaxID=2754725 RepID=A0A7G7CQL3_9CORY|nr:glycosyltransferase family 4 protein [Corynebacterium incognita]QNE89879.1 glycosyltransferase family 4 protein [Corynebacterium incognita]